MSTPQEIATEIVQKHYNNRHTTNPVPLENDITKAIQAERDIANDLLIGRNKADVVIDELRKQLIDMKRPGVLQITQENEKLRKDNDRLKKLCK